MNKTITLALDENETATLLQLLDLALKAVGTPAATAVVHFNQKIEAAKSPAPAPVALPAQAGE